MHANPWREVDLQFSAVACDRLQRFDGRVPPSLHHLSELSSKSVCFVQDLCIKTAVWTPMYYGPLEYLLSYAAAGSMLQLHVISRAFPNAPVAIGPCIDIAAPAGRAVAVLVSFNLYRLLGVVNLKLPQSVLPVGKDLVAENKSLGFTRTLLFRSDVAMVQKCIQPWSAYRDSYHMDLSWLEQMYEATAASAGLVHKVPSKGTISVDKDRYSIQLQPIGLRNGDALPSCGSDVRQACHGFLHGLDALHQVRSSVPSWLSILMMHSPQLSNCPSAWQRVHVLRRQEACIPDRHSYPGLGA